MTGTWTAAECAAHCGIAVATWRSYTRTGGIGPAHLPGYDDQRRRRWLAADVIAFQASRPGQGRRTDLKETTVNVTAALIASGVDRDAITRTPNHVWTITRPDGSRLALGEDHDDAGEPAGWTWTIYSADDEIASTDYATTLRQAATSVAAWAR